MVDDRPLIFRYLHCMKVCLVRFLILFLASIPVFAVIGGLSKSDNVQGAGAISLVLLSGWGVVFAILSYRKRIEYGNISRSFISELPEDKKFVFWTEIKKIFKRNRKDLIAETLVYITLILLFVISSLFDDPEYSGDILLCIGYFIVCFVFFFTPFLIINIGVWVKVEKKWLRDHIDLITKNETERTDNYENKN